MNTWIRWIR